ncbi:MAG: multicopper oxidase domain-containing protein [Streptosporangiales bacterium]|nr:multicopper oxidase domain-containing protein [Streptosporangiales bacterium]
MSTIDRRGLLRAGLAVPTLSVLAACGSNDTASPRLITPTDNRVRAVEAARRTTGRIRKYTLRAVVETVDLGGPTVQTWTYDGVLPGSEIRVRRGDVVEAALVNRLPAKTTIHWHGVALRNDMDGVPDVTQAAVAKGATFAYRFVAADAGTYWFHPHSGVQLDRGLYAPLIVEAPDEPGAYDAEWTVVLDDWIDGTGYTPDQVFETVRNGMGGMDHGGEDMDGPMLMGATSELLGGDAGDVRYLYFLVNGRVAAAPRTLRAKPRQRVRIRFINAGSDTAFRVALGGHMMRVTHADGFPLVPVETDALLVGMGERYDVVVRLGDGVFPLTALAEGKKATARALVRTGSGEVPPVSERPRELDGKVLRYAALRAADDVRLRAKAPDINHDLELTGGMMDYDWAINGRRYDPKRSLPIREGQRVRVTFRNSTTMWHPMHIHGHTFQIGDDGPRKDTAIVLPKQTITCDFDADNPGQWLTHCHNVYHGEAGMMTALGYRD